MSKNEIMEQLKDILLSADPTSSERIQNCTESTSLLNDLGLSSVSMLYMVIAIEETFRIRFDNVGVTDFATMGDVVNYIEKKLS